MAFQPGHPQYGSKKKGSHHKYKTAFLNLVTSVLEGYPAERFLADLEEMTAVDRAKTILSIAEFAFPRLARSTGEQNISINIQKDAFLIGGKTMYLDGIEPREVET